MALLNYQKKEINAKIVYYGPGLSGKTTNIQIIYKKLKPEYRGKLMTLATQTDRTLFFDFLPVELGDIKGLKTRFQIYTVPGQVYYNATRKLVLKNVDGVVFVADSQKKMFNENVESLKNLEENLKFYNRNLRDIPHVFQYNKRDLPDILSVKELEDALNRTNAPYFEAVAHKGQGVLQVLTTISKLVLQKLRTSSDFAKVEKESVEPGSEKAQPEVSEPSSSVGESSEPIEVDVEPVTSLGDTGINTALTGKIASHVVVPKMSVAGDSGVKIGTPEVVKKGSVKIPLILEIDGKTKTINITISIEK